MITELEFKSLAAQGFNRIPLIAEAFADLETPLSRCTSSLPAASGQQLPAGKRGRRRTFRPLLLHRPARAGRWCVATGTLKSESRHATVPSSRRHEGNPLDFIAAYQARFKPALRPGLPRFCGGLAGYFGYDDGALRSSPAWPTPRKTGGIGHARHPAAADRGTGRHRQPVSGRLYLIVWADPGQPEAYFNGKRRLSELTDKLRFSVTAPPVQAAAPATQWSASSRASDLEAAVLKRQGLHRRRRLHAGRHRPAVEEALHRKPAVAVPRACVR